MRYCSICKLYTPTCILLIQPVMPEGNHCICISKSLAVLLLVWSSLLSSHHCFSNLFSHCHCNFVLCYSYWIHSSKWFIIFNVIIRFPKDYFQWEIIPTFTVTVASNEVMSGVKKGLSRLDGSVTVSLFAAIVIKFASSARFVGVTSENQIKKYYNYIGGTIYKTLQVLLK